MVDLERRKFLKLSIKLISTSSALIATYPLQSIYAEKVRPTLIEKYQDKKIPEKLDFSKLNSVVPHILASSAIMTFIMMHADSLQSLLIIIVSTLALIFLGLPITELTLSHFN